MKLPRIYHKLYAKSTGYFWLPCPLCGREFGGHEWGDSPWATIPTDIENSRTGVCPACEQSRHQAGIWDRPWTPMSSDA
jgi:hypothetical protein